MALYFISLSLPDGGAIVLCDMSNPDRALSNDTIERNVYRIDTQGMVVRQIVPVQAVRPRTPFTNIYFESDGKLRAFRFDCHEHEIDIQTGRSRIIDFLK